MAQPHEGGVTVHEVKIISMIAADETAKQGHLVEKALFCENLGKFLQQTDCGIQSIEWLKGENNKIRIWFKPDDYETIDVWGMSFFDIIEAVIKIFD